MAALVSIEGYFLLNLCMNLLLLSAIAGARGHISWGALVISASFGALYAVAMQTQTFALLRVWPMRVALTLLMALGGLRPINPVDCLCAVCLMLSGTVLVGGAQLFLMSHGGRTAGLWALSGAVGYGLLRFMLGQRRQRLERFEVRLIIEYRGRKIRLTALIDTGNRMREPLSGLPVLIVDAARLKRLLPEGLDPLHPQGTLPRGFRLAAYGTLGGVGEMALFRPDRLSMGQGSGYVRAPDVWVGICPRGLPNDVQALAPPVLGLMGNQKMMRVKESG